MASVSLRGIQKNYGHGAPSAVANLDLEIADGEFLCVLGPSGCGKTTTLRMIAGLEHPTAGQIMVGDRVVDSVEQGTYVPPEKRGMGLVFQSYALWPHLTVQDNVEFGLRLRKMDRVTRKQKAAEVMKALGIEKYSARYPSELSGGQQQRVALARMLVVHPEVILLDEPLSNLDAKLRLEMRAELKRIHAEFKSTVVFVTHDQWEAMTLATTIAVMSEGHLQQLGTPDTIYDQPANRFVAEFVGNLPINIIELDEPSDMATLMAGYLREHVPQLGRPGSVGIRPEAFQLADSDALVPGGAFYGKARVTGVLPTGGNWIVELQTIERKIFMITSELPRAQVDDEVVFWTASRNLHLFDAEGTRLTDADTLLKEVHR